MNLDIDFFKIEKQNLIPEKGRILISEPFLEDSYFGRSVVYLTDHSEEGSVGFILNRFSDVKVSEMLENFPVESLKICLGGPVETNTIHFLHTLGEFLPNSVHIVDNLYWGGDFEQLKVFIETGVVNENQVRIFLGYSGWEPGQLEKELSENYWIVADIKERNIMSYNDRLWQDCLITLGGKYKTWVNIPTDPDMN